MKLIKKHNLMIYSTFILIGLVLLAGSCSKGNVQISQPNVDKEGGIAEAGKTASLSVEVKNPGKIQLDYEWRAEKGSVVSSNLSPTAAIYTAPNATGEDNVILRVTSRGKAIFISEPVRIKIVQKITDPPTKRSKDYYYKITTKWIRSYRDE